MVDIFENALYNICVFRSCGSSVMNKDLSYLKALPSPAPTVPGVSWFSNLDCLLTLQPYMGLALKLNIDQSKVSSISQSGP